MGTVTPLVVISNLGGLDGSVAELVVVVVDERPRVTVCGVDLATKNKAVAATEIATSTTKDRRRRTLADGPLRLGGPCSRIRSLTN